MAIAGKLAFRGAEFCQPCKCNFYSLDSALEMTKDTNCSRFSISINSLNRGKNDRL